MLLQALIDLREAVVEIAAHETIRSDLMVKMTETSQWRFPLQLLYAIRFLITIDAAAATITAGTTVLFTGAAG